MKNTERGLKIEKDIINHINENKYIEKMNLNISLFLKEIFEMDLKNVLIKAMKYHENYKPDIVIEANSIKKYISIKSGKDNSVHQEHIHSFCNFLCEMRVSQSTINNLKLFHFNDMTTNGSGKEKKDAHNFLKLHSDICDKINKELNETKTKKACIERILFDGEYHNLPSVDYIYYGSYEKGIWAKKEKISNYLCSQNLNTLSIHISKLYYQAWQRNLQNNDRSEFRRYFVQFKWHSIEKDISAIKRK